MTKPKAKTETDEAPSRVVPQALQEKAVIEGNKAGNPGFPEDTSASK